MREEYNIAIAGVGGQGVLTAAKLLGIAALRNNVKVRIGEIHGLSQRFGSVVSFVRFGDNVYGAMIPEGKGDVILALEPIEALRYIKYMKIGGTVIANSNPIPPIQVLLGTARYPSLEEIRGVITGRYKGKLYLIDAERLAIRAGSPLTLNTVMLGALAGTKGFPFPIEEIERSIDEAIPEKYVEANKQALHLGYMEMKKQS